jgi:hypothetical protein
MKTPRVQDFDPTAKVPQLGSPMDNLPSIQKPSDNQITSKLANQQGSKLLKKFGSYLPPETIKSLKRYAFENDQEVYEVLKEAIDLYLEQKQR